VCVHTVDLDSCMYTYDGIFRLIYVFGVYTSKVYLDSFVYLVCIYTVHLDSFMYTYEGIFGLICVFGVYTSGLFRLIYIHL